MVCDDELGFILSYLKKQKRLRVFINISLLLMHLQRLFQLLHLSLTDTEETVKGLLFMMQVTDRGI